MANEIQQFFKDHGIQEVEAIVPDMAGIARGKVMPAEKFAEDVRDCRIRDTDVQHERWANGREAAFGTSARWRG